MIGMTNLPEARLAREAELSYATMALATDYDCWHEGEEDVTVEGVIATLTKNVENAKQVIRALVRNHDPASVSESPVRRALEHAVMTAPEAIPAAARERLSLFLDRGRKG